MNYTSVGINRHKVLNGLAQEDPTYENYLRLAEWIFTGKVSLIDLLDQEEATRRMKEIDELRLSKKIEKNNITKRKNAYNKTIIEVINTKTKEKSFYKSIREFCKTTGISRTCIKKIFEKEQGTKILYKDLIIKKVKRDTLKSRIELHRICLNPNLDKDKHNTKWNDYEKAFIVQNRPQMAWKDIEIFLGRSAESCSKAMRKIKTNGQLEYYKNLDISGILEIGA